MSYAFIYIMIEIFAMAITAILIVAACSRKNIMRKPECYVLFLACSNLLILLNDILQMGLKGNAETLLLYKIIWLLAPVNVFAELLSFHLYLVGCLSQKTTVSHKINVPVVVFFMISVCLWALSMWTGWFYEITDEATYVYTDFTIIGQYGALILTWLIDIVLIVKNRKVLGLWETLAWLAYIAIPCAMIPLTIEFDVIPIYLGATLSIFVIYTMISVRNEKQLAEQRLEIAESRSRLMLSQIKPHFLYNSLTSIAYLCEEDPKKAQEATIAFSDFLRHNMNSLTDRHIVPFEKELEHLRTYLYIEQMRFGDALMVEYDVQTTDFYIPTLTLQPVVENAVKHGVCQKEEGGTVSIAVKKNNGCVIITVSDDGVGYDVSKIKEDGKAHVGLDNVRRRLAMCNGTLTVKSAIGVGTVVTITIRLGEQTQ